MNKLVTFVFLGLLFAAPGEILNQILARQNLVAFRSTMISYVVLLLIAFLVGKAAVRVFGAFTGRLLYYLCFGFLGLMVEWFLLGNAPVLDPFQIVTQPGMFSFWGTLVLGPCLVMEVPSSPLKRSFLMFFAGYSLLYLVTALVVPRAKGGIFFGFVLFAAGTAALNYFYVRYFRALRNKQAPEPSVRHLNHQRMVGKG